MGAAMSKQTETSFKILGGQDVAAKVESVLGRNFTVMGKPQGPVRQRKGRGSAQKPIELVCAMARIPPPISLLELHAANHESNSACLVVSVVTVVVVTGPDPLPAPRGRLPTPTRAAIETNADAKWHRREGKAAIVEPIEPGERKPIDAWCKSRPERKAA